jgi:hypothetical protein
MALGCITFEVGKNAALVEFLFTPNSEFGPETGSWTIP